MGNRVFNFAAGPSQLPLEVLQKAGNEITDYHGTGMSVMEMSHRSTMFQQIFLDTKNRLRSLMQVPDNYEILFLQGGGSTQFSMVPLNLISRTGMNHQISRFIYNDDVIIFKYYSYITRESDSINIIYIHFEFFT